MRLPRPGKSGLAMTNLTPPHLNPLPRGRGEGEGEIKGTGYFPLSLDLIT